jgi:2-polyprenyl-3-methyl-5-hydroxy-6-metoxy-1,4-benzoquinol methylase
MVEDFSWYEYDIKEKNIPWKWGVIVKDGSVFWNSVAKNYDEYTKERYKQAYEKLLLISKKYVKKTDRVLDLGCGTGMTTLQMARDVREIVAIDYSVNMIEVAKMKAAYSGISNITFCVEKAEKQIEVYEPFDVVVAFNLLCYLKNPEEVYRQISRALKPGGIFISATDCLGNEEPWLQRMMKFSLVFGAAPLIRFISTSKLEEEIQAHQFVIFERENLYSNPPNHLIVAEKASN